MERQEHKIERRLAAILAADVAGYSRLMSQDEVGTLRTLTPTAKSWTSSLPSVEGISPTPPVTAFWLNSRVPLKLSNVLWTSKMLLQRQIRTPLKSVASGFGSECMSAT